MIVDRIPTREAYGQALVRLGEENPRIVVIEADISKSTRTLYFAKRFPERFFNVGVAEQNAMLIAAGLAATGKIPFVSTYAVFASMRACEQVRTFICYPRLNVKIGASHGGLTPGNDGVTHQGTEDMGILRSIPNMTVIMPADAIATNRLVRAAAQYDGPVYLRFTRDPMPIFYEESQEFAIGKGVTVRQGSDVTIIAIGDMVFHSLEAAEQLAKEGIGARVIDMHTVKPIDREVVLKAAQETGAIVTAEDHQVMNGLGSAVAEVVVQNKLVPVELVGIPDTFGESGPYERLLEKYGLSARHIALAVLRVLGRKTLTNRASA